MLMVPRCSKDVAGDTRVLSQRSENNWVYLGHMLLVV